MIRPKGHRKAIFKYSRSVRRTAHLSCFTESLCIVSRGHLYLGSSRVSLVPKANRGTESSNRWPALPSQFQLVQSSWTFPQDCHKQDSLYLQKLTGQSKIIFNKTVTLLTENRRSNCLYICTFVHLYTCKFVHLYISHSNLSMRFCDTA
jgi:hypothetical protein